jgi:CheY-like chemotaxis protein
VEGGSAALEISGDERGRDGIAEPELRDSDRPATPPPDVRSTLPGLIRNPRRSDPLEAGSKRSRAPAAAMHVLIVEPDIETRDRLVAALLEQGCDVNAFCTSRRAEIHAIYWGYDVLIARPEILEQTSYWHNMVPGRRPLGSLAVARSSDADTRIRALNAGARCVLSPPFDTPSLGANLRVALTQLRSERRG